MFKSGIFMVSVISCIGLNANQPQVHVFKEVKKGSPLLRRVSHRSLGSQFPPPLTLGETALHDRHAPPLPRAKEQSKLAYCCNVVGGYLTSCCFTLCDKIFPNPK
jgi:hypothetical protein